MYIFPDMDMRTRLHAHIREDCKSIIYFTHVLPQPSLFVTCILTCMFPCFPVHQY